MKEDNTCKFEDLTSALHAIDTMQQPLMKRALTQLV